MAKPRLTFHRKLEIIKNINILGQILWNMYTGYSIFLWTFNNYINLYIFL